MAINIPYDSGGSISRFPSLPEPLSGDGQPGTQGEKIPHKGVLIDVVDVPHTVGTQPYQGRLLDSVIWTVNPSGINAAVAAWLGGYSNWYDDINDRLYVVGVQTNTAPDTYHFAYITLETGAVTNVGSSQVTVDPTAPTIRGNCAISRPAIDSGNFTLTFTDRTIVIDENTGVEVSNVVSTNTSESLLIGNYVTLDSTIFVNILTNFSDANTYIYLTKNNTTVWVPIPVINLIGTLTSQQVGFMAWGNKVKTFDLAGGQVSLIRTFLRADFDVWLKDVAAYGGIA